MCKSFEDLSPLEHALQFHSDIYKDLTGCRPRLDPDQWTLAEIEAEIHSISLQLNEQMQWEKEEDEFRALIARENARLKGMYVDGRVPGEQYA